MDCEICGLFMKTHTLTKHHLVPKAQRKKFGMKEFGVRNRTIKVHKFCHAILHIIFDNEQLARDLNTRKKIKRNPIIQRYVAFIKQQSSNFYVDFTSSMKDASKIGEQFINDR
ncbi:MAG: hypothetical protein WC554_16500 [Clostridia bacterium]